MKKRMFFFLFCFLFTASLAQAELLVNPGFEESWTGSTSTISGPGYVYQPTGPSMGWTFTGGAGVSMNATAWGGTAQQGGQFAFIQQGNSSTSGTGSSAIEQTFTLAAAADTELAFYMVLRSYYPAGQQIIVLVDGVAQGVYTATGDWTLQTVDFGILAAGTHTLTFAGTGALDSYGRALDTSAFLDNISLTATAVPVPAAAWLLGSGLVGLAGLRRKIKK